MNPPPMDPTGDNLIALAGELYLGLLDAEETRRANALSAQNPDFDAALRAWENRLMPLATCLAPVVPPERVWHQIERAIAVAAPRAPKTRQWIRFGFWRLFGVSSGVVALAATLLLVIYPRSPAPLPVATTILASATHGSFLVSARRTASGMSLLVKPSHVNVPSGTSAELWVVLQGNKPASLGTLPSDHARAITLTGGQLGGATSAVVLAVSIEPFGGSPSGQVTGPIIASAKFIAPALPGNQPSP